MIAVARRPIREYVDFARVPEPQIVMHERLENWARWCRGTSGRDNAPSQPMFALYRSTDAKRQERITGALTATPVIKADAQLIQTAIAQPDFPTDNRWALHWAYLYPNRSPVKAADGLGVSLARLCELVIEARAMLIEREI